MSGGCLKGVWKVFGRCLKGVKKVSEGCLEGVLRVTCSCLNVVDRVSGMSLKGVWIITFLPRGLMYASLTQKNKMIQGGCQA